MSVAVGRLVPGDSIEQVANRLIKARIECVVPRAQGAFPQLFSGQDNFDGKPSARVSIAQSASQGGLALGQLVSQSPLGAGRIAVELRMAEQPLQCQFRKHLAALHGVSSQEVPRRRVPPAHSPTNPCRRRAPGAARGREIRKRPLRRSSPDGRDRSHKTCRGRCCNSMSAVGPAIVTPPA